VTKSDIQLSVGPDVRSVTLNGIPVMESEKDSTEPKCITPESANPSSCSDGPSSTIETPSLQSISDVVAFSLSSLCAIRLNHLYPEEYHAPFKKSTIHLIVEHFGLPNRVENSIHEFIEDDEFTFLSSIKHNHGEKVFQLIEELVLLCISTSTYDARMHYLIINVAELLGIPRELVEIHCESIYDLLLHASPTGNLKSSDTTDTASGCADDQDAESKRYRERRDTRKRIKKYLMIGLASLGGGAVIGVTGGLAAPIVASAFGAAIGAGTFAMSSAAAGVVGSLFGVAGAGLTASKMQKRIGDLEEFAFESLNPKYDQTSLTITIAISGWITEEGENQFLRPWRCLNHSKEQYCLRYESKYLLELSQAMDYLLSFVVSYAAQEALKYTFLAGVMAAIAWPTALISMANIIDNPWDVCVGRSAEAGKHLADVLISRQQGRRPVSLIGFSLGARVIYFCLQELARRPNSEGIICDVVLLGAPVSASQDQWRPLRRVISGQIINGYSSSDWLLKFLYRTSSAAIRVAGLQPLCWQDKKVKNIDLTSLVGGHMDYYKKLQEILEFVNIGTFAKESLKQAASDGDSHDVHEGRELAPICLSGQTVLVASPEEVRKFEGNNETIELNGGSQSTSSGMGRSISQQSASTMEEISASFSQQSLVAEPSVVAGAGAVGAASSDLAHQQQQTKERAIVIDPLGASQMASLAPPVKGGALDQEEADSPRQQSGRTLVAEEAQTKMATTSSAGSSITRTTMSSPNNGGPTGRAGEEAARRGGRSGGEMRLARKGSLTPLRCPGSRPGSLASRPICLGQNGSEGGYELASARVPEESANEAEGGRAEATELASGASGSARQALAEAAAARLRPTTSVHFCKHNEKRQRTRSA